MTIAISGTNIFAGTWGGGIFKSTNNGTSWNGVNTGISNLNIYTIVVMGTNVFAGTAITGVIKTTNNGTSWTSSGLTNHDVKALHVSGTNIFAGPDYGGIYLSTNYGVTWLEKNQGFTTLPTVSALSSTNDYIFACTEGQLLWRRSHTEIIEVKNISIEIPSCYKLSQNYPNPFNPATNIRYQITNKSFVMLKIFDIMGREVETLVNKKQNAGTYEATWDASNYPSGLYFYKLEAGDFSQVKKMILLK
jgi:hypothetical protein